MKPAELAALGLRLTALVLNVVAVMWGCAFVVLFLISAYTVFGYENDRWRMPIFAAMSAVIGTMLFLTSFYFRRRAEKIVALDARVALDHSDRCMAEPLIAVIVASGAIIAVDAMLQLIGDWHLAAQFGGSFDELMEYDGWHFRLRTHLLDLLAALVFIFGGPYIVRIILRIKAWVRTPIAPQIDP